MAGKDIVRADIQSLGEAVAAAARRRHSDLVQAAVVDLRFPIRDMEREVDRAIAALDRLGELDPWLSGRTPLCDSHQSVAVMFPYNIGPLGIFIATAIAAAGNRVSARFSSRAPSIAALCAEVLAEANVTDRIAIEVAPAVEFVRRVLAQPETPVVVAYGGEALGRQLISSALGTKIIFEGPGKDPLIAGALTTPERLQEVLRVAKFSRSGQECVATERLIVPRGRQDLIDAVVELARGLNVGSADDVETDVAELGSPSLPATIGAQLDEAVARGARILTGGGIHGALVEPTVVVDVPADCALWQDETFGPVIPIRETPDPESALADALSGRHGLHGIVLGSDLPGLGEMLAGAGYGHPIDGLVTGSIGVVSFDRQIFTEPEDDYRPFGGWGVSGWIREADGTLMQGPRVLARETTQAAE